MIKHAQHCFLRVQWADCPRQRVCSRFHINVEVAQEDHWNPQMQHRGDRKHQSRVYNGILEDLQTIYSWEENRLIELQRFFLECAI